MKNLVRHSLAVLLLGACTMVAGAKPSAAKVEQVKLGGYVGERIDLCLDKRVKTENVVALTAPFYKQDETQGRWQSEFWGKWVQGAMSMYRYTGDKQLYDTIKASVDRMLKAQLSNGYIGNYDTQHQLTFWDVWGRKYTTLGLLKWYRLSGDKRALKAACRLIDYTITQIGPGGKPIKDVGLYHGMASGSILEPVMMLYNDTKQERYLDFAKHIVAELEKPDGAQLIAKADEPVSQRYPVSEEDWWTQKNGQKAYEMMSCHVGLLELYKVTGDERLLTTVKKLVNHIINEEINVCGSGAAYECWYGGKDKQYIPTYHSEESCVTFTWMQLCERMLQITGDSRFADQIEQTMYNAMMAFMKDDGTKMAMYIPLEGVRQNNDGQCGMHINCCNANGPRAYAMVPRVAFMTRGADSVDVNLYIPGEAKLNVNKQDVTLKVTTDYPRTGLVTITVQNAKDVPFSMGLRIPEWAEDVKVAVNGVEQSGITAGTYLRLARTWKNGDQVTLSVPMTTEVITLHNHLALKRGPVALARDSRFNDGSVDEALLLLSKNGKIDLTPIEAPKGMWMAFELKAILGTYGEFSYGANDAPLSTIKVCDFGSAGNTWNPQLRYRVWLPEAYTPRVPANKK